MVVVITTIAIQKSIGFGRARSGQWAHYPLVILVIIAHHPPLLLALDPQPTRMLPIGSLDTKINTELDSNEWPPLMSYPGLVAACRSALAGVFVLSVWVWLNLASSFLINRSSCLLCLIEALGQRVCVFVELVVLGQVVDQRAPASRANKESRRAATRIESEPICSWLATRAPTTNRLSRWRRSMSLSEVALEVRASHFDSFQRAGC